MKPIGLTCKSDGEIMIVHLCLECNKISCNRIAGDDEGHILLSLLEAIDTLEDNIRTQVYHRGITLLTPKDKEIVLISLYGYDYKRYMPSNT